ncbi:MAG TPA: hypothetical protein VMU54_17825, partial [Planctomycetota bacterium]|nr:hypothetical protein [Planctomycetota bacterium]
VQFLGMTAEQLCSLHGCRIVHFMFHDRVAFGGALIAAGILYLWLAAFPLEAGEAWAWWLFALSGGAGFLSFLAYLGYGYLDSWHGTATLALLPCFGVGLARTFGRLKAPRSLRSLIRPADGWPWGSPGAVGRLLLLGTALGMIAGGGTILVVGMTSVFVPTDLQFMGLRVEDLRAVNPRLVSLIAHDRAGFGGAISTTGILVLGCVWWGRPSRSLWQALALSGAAGFACAIGVHFAVGYTDWLHLFPAAAGGLMFLGGMICSRRSMLAPSAEAGR